jgi:DNA helicase-2/ATP-dependent DNA helicase PcrA
MTNYPQLQGDALEARDSDSEHIQIIASAGSGKTETISQRVARLVADGVDPSTIVAFTFTVKAAEELKSRIRDRVEALAGPEAADKLGGLYVGTIHGFCLQLLQSFISIYESYEMIDENQLAAFAMRWKNKLELGRFDTENPEKGRVFAGMRTFLENVQVVENELLTLDQLGEEFAGAIEILNELLDQHRLLTFGMQIGRAITELEKPEVRELVAPKIQHLIVDEYQDINPAQERLIQLLSKPVGSANLVVVGDDDQAIYQWRGSSVDNITTFSSRYPAVKTFKLLVNRRSRPSIVRLADRFAQTIPGRLEKEMGASRETNGPSVDIVLDYETEAAEAHDIAKTIQRLVKRGYNYSQIAILVRASTAYPAILEALEAAGIPVSPGDRTGLFAQPDADFLARIFAWLSDGEWRESKYAPTEGEVTLENIKEKFDVLYAVEWKAVETFLKSQKEKVGEDTRQISLVQLSYGLLEVLGVADWDAHFVVYTSRLGTIAKFLRFIGDYEGMRKHARIDAEGKQTGAGDYGKWYFQDVTSLMSHFARDAYKDFGGEKDFSGDAVDVMTVHTAKGLEWPIVFVPSMTAKRFPSSNTGKSKNWLVSPDLFEATRYEGTDADERRLFYVAITRAREWLSLSAHQKVKTQSVKPSVYIEKILEIYDDTKDFPPDWSEPNSIQDSEILQITYSEIADYLSCGWSYWLKSRIGFPAAVVEEIGYGRAVHHLMRAIAEETARKGKPLGPMEVDKLIATDFFLPFATSAIAARYKESARKLAFSYLKEYSEEMNRVWETERPFELAIEGALITGRADVILEKHEGVPDDLAIIDYKTGTEGQEFDLQLQIYAEAGFREGLSVRGAFVHDLGDQKRIEVDTSESARTAAVQKVSVVIESVKNREFPAKPEVSKCGRCDVRAICRQAAKAKK